MADAPDLATGMAEEPGRRQEKQPPAALPEFCLNTIGLAQDGRMAAWLASKLASQASAVCS